jgi:hypothetical protein
MCAIKQGRGGVYVGFLDVRAKPEKSYYLKVGDSEDGIDVLEADFVKEAVKLRKGGDEQWLYMDGRAADAPRGPEAPAAVAMAPALGVPPSAPPTVSPPPLPPMAMPSSPPSIVSPPRPPMVPPPTVAGSYAERLRKRREILEARRRADEAQPKLSGEDLQKQLQEYNLKLIRAKGALGPPLPIPLTPEQDAALVSEGVLPPQ